MDKIKGALLDSESIFFIVFITFAIALLVLALVAGFSTTYVGCFVVDKYVTTAGNFVVVEEFKTDVIIGKYVFESYEILVTDEQYSLFNVGDSVVVRGEGILLLGGDCQ